MIEPFDDEALEEPEEEESGSNRPGLLTFLIVLLLIAALLSTLLWPLLPRPGRDSRPYPTPTPPFLQEASLENRIPLPPSPQHCEEG